MNRDEFYEPIKNIIKRANREFNDSITRDTVRVYIENFLTDCKEQKRLSNFKVICDEFNNNHHVIDRYEFIVDVYIENSNPSYGLWTKFIISPNIIIHVD